MFQGATGHAARASEALLRRLPEDRAGQCPQPPDRARPRRPSSTGSRAGVQVRRSLPLYRQSQIYAREGLELDRSTLADWVGGASALLSPLVQALVRYVLATYKLHGDDTPVPVLCPGRGTTKQGRLWAYVRDDRPPRARSPPPSSSATPRIARASGRERIWRALPACSSRCLCRLDRLYGDRITEEACWAHVRRKFFDIHTALASPIAAEALDRIGRLTALKLRSAAAPMNDAG